MTSVFSYINQRQFGAYEKFPKEWRNPRLNYDFLLRKFACHDSNSYAIAGEEDFLVPPFACQFRTHCVGDNAYMLAVASEEGNILLIDTNHKKSIIASWAAHSNAIFDVAWLPYRPGLITCSGDHTCAIWDITKGEHVCSLKSHTASVRCLGVSSSQSAVFASGSRDGSIKIWDLRLHRIMNSEGELKPEINIQDAHINGNIVTQKRKKRSSLVTRSVSSVVFQDAHHLASSGVGDKNIKLWDLRRTYVNNMKKVPAPKQTFSHNAENKHSLSGYTSIAFDSSYRYIYACCINNVIYRFDSSSQSNPLIYTGFKAETYFVKIALSLDDQYLLSGSSDEKAYIWKVSEPGAPIVKLSGHASEVTAVAWNPNDISNIATCGDDNRVFVWWVQTDEGIEHNNHAGFTIPIPKDNSNTKPIDHETSTTKEHTWIQPVNKSIVVKEKSLYDFFPTIQSKPQSENRNRLTANSSGKGESPTSASSPPCTDREQDRTAHVVLSPIKNPCNSDNRMIGKNGQPSPEACTSNSPKEHIYSRTMATEKENINAEAQLSTDHKKSLHKPGYSAATLRQSLVSPTLPAKKNILKRKKSNSPNNKGNLKLKKCSTSNKNLITCYFQDTSPS